MTTPHGISCVIERLEECRDDYPALKARWGNLGVTYQREPKVKAARDKLKARFTNG